MISVDRRERGSDDRAALDQLSDEMGMPCYSVVTVGDVIEYLHRREIDGRVVIDDEIRNRMEQYLAEYGPRNRTV